ncbi:MAG: two-component system sensor histidine kinase NtrB [Bacillota bacterium]
MNVREVLEFLDTGVLVVARTQLGYKVMFANTAAKHLLARVGKGLGALVDESILFAKEGLWPVALSFLTGEKQCASGLELRGKTSVKVNVKCMPCTAHREGNGRVQAVVALLEEVCGETGRRECKVRRTSLEIAATAIHEIRNPLTSVKGFLQLLREDRLSVLDEDIDTALSEVERIECVLSDVLILSSPGNPMSKSVDLNQFLESYFARSPVYARMEGRKLVRRYDARALPVRIDTRQMRHVLDNLLKNACEAIEEGDGCIFVETALDSEMMARVTIRDTGCGIAPQAMRSAFQPFFTTKENGTGLGLSVVLKILVAHRGFVEVESEPGKGAAFHVFLPLAQSSQCGGSQA